MKLNPQQIKDLARYKFCYVENHDEGFSACQLSVQPEEGVVQIAEGAFNNGRITARIETIEWDEDRRCFFGIFDTEEEWFWILQEHPMHINISKRLESKISEEQKNINIPESPDHNSEVSGNIELL